MTDQTARPTGAWAELQFPKSKTTSTPCCRRATKFSPRWKPMPARTMSPIVGPAVARVLYQLAIISGAKKIFEMGSAIGYSTIWWARAVGEGGRVIYTDGDPKHAEKARRYFDRAGVSQRITVRVGDALEFLSEEKEHYDIIFNDVDKTDYPRVFRLALPRLKSGGLFITDNVLWSGKRRQAQSRRQTKAILEFNKLIYESRICLRRFCRSATEFRFA